MFKSKVRSMQRGAQVREVDNLRPKSAYEGVSPIFSKADELHFNHRDISRAILASRLRPAVIALAKNGFRKPADVSPLLNKFGYTTACGAPWTPRLVWFLLNDIFGNNDDTGKAHLSKSTGIIPRPTKHKSKLLSAKRSPPEISEWASAIIVVECQISKELLSSSIARLTAFNVVYVFGSNTDSKRISRLLPNSRVVSVNNAANRNMILEATEFILRI